MRKMKSAILSKKPIPESLYYFPISCLGGNISWTLEAIQSAIGNHFILSLNFNHDFFSRKLPGTSASISRNIL